MRSQTTVAQQSHVVQSNNLAASTFLASALALAVAGISNPCLASMPEEGMSSEEAHWSNLENKYRGPMTARDETPEELKFSSGQLVNTLDGVQMILKVPGGIPSDIIGLLQTVDEEGVTSLTFEEDHGEGSVQALNSEGTYVKLNLRRLRVTLEEFEQGPTGDGFQSPVFEDDIYKAYRWLLTVLSIRKDYAVRDMLLQANSSLVILRANGDMDIRLYRRLGDGTVECLGEVLVDSHMRYEMTETSPEALMFIERQNQAQQELIELDKNIKEMQKTIAQMVRTGEHTGLQQKKDEIDVMTERFQTLYEQIQIPTDFEFFAVSEHFDYEASHIVKWTSDSGVELGSQVAANQILSGLATSEASKMIANDNTQRILRDVGHHMNMLRNKGDMYAGETLLQYITRKLAQSWSILKGEYPSPSFDKSDNLVTPVLEVQGIKNQIVEGFSIDDTIKQLHDAHINTSGRLKPDHSLVHPDHLKEMQEALNNASWTAYLKSFFGKGKYQQSYLALNVQNLLKQRGFRHLDELVGSNRVPAGSLTGDEAKDKVFLNQIAGEQQDEISKEASKESQGYKIINTGNAVIGTVTAGVTAGFSGYALQYGLDAGTKYYNEGVLPWDYTAKDSEEVYNRAVQTGTLSSVSGALNYWVLPEVVKHREYFTHVTPEALKRTGIANHYAGAVAGGIAGFTARALSSGYSYLRGDLSGKDYAYELADAGARTLPTMAGSALGHYLLPYSFNTFGLAQLPIIGMPFAAVANAVGPTVGSIVGSVGANILYDTGKYHIFNGFKQASDYIYGEDATTPAFTTPSPRQAAVEAQVDTHSHHDYQVHEEVPVSEDERDLITADSDEVAIEL
ncbi:hypothetical protein [Parendozoicomonas sp. Alg238-R29]|uniref:hypothetical protein n=1 Tax=Parendozoicomonas sp. Alg238-R29 TaxID=2993446 RepID=UPI00248E389D|nr:hypothetical protein [Parendozoicomonas sp. Alg238-R29]